MATAIWTWKCSTIANFLEPIAYSAESTALNMTPWTPPFPFQRRVNAVEKSFLVNIGTAGLGCILPAQRLTCSNPFPFPYLSTAVQKIVNDLDAEYTGELSLKQQEIRETREELRLLQAQLDEAQLTTATLKGQALKLDEAEKRIKILEAALNGRDGGLLHFESYGGNMVEDPNSVLNVLNEEQGNDSQMLMTHAETEKENLSDHGTSTPANGAVRRALLQSPRPSNQLLMNGHVTDTVQQQEAKIQQLQLKINSCTKSELELKKQLEDLNAQSSEKEMQYKKLIAVCCGITLERVDDLLQPLIQAVECEQMANLDIGKVEDFMATVHNDDGGDGTAMTMDDTMTMADAIGQQQQ
jgi:hypothetical protein